MFMEPRIIKGNWVTVTCDEWNDPERTRLLDLSDYHDLMGYIEAGKDHRQVVKDIRDNTPGIADRVIHRLEKLSRIMDGVTQELVEQGVRTLFGLTGEIEVDIHEDAYKVYLSASGYLDQTDWVICTTKEDARKHLDSMYAIVECEKHGWQEYDEDGCPPCQDTEGEAQPEAVAV